MLNHNPENLRGSKLQLVLSAHKLKFELFL